LDVPRCNRARVVLYRDRPSRFDDTLPEQSRAANIGWVEPKRSRRKKMKLFAILAAGAVVASSMIPAAVSAQDRVIRERTVVRHGPARHHVRSRTVCKTVWNHGHRNRVCRTVRR
jgi:hypothetical protein